MHLCVLLFVTDDRLGHQCRCGKHADVDGLAVGFRHTPKFKRQPVNLGKHGGQFLREKAPVFRQRDISAPVVKQRHAQFLFQFMNCLGERGLRDVQFFGAFGHMLGFCHFQEKAELRQFHSVLLYRRSLSIS